MSIGNKLPVTAGLASGGSNVSVRHLFVYLSFVARSRFFAENPARTPSRSDVSHYFMKERITIFSMHYLSNSFIESAKILSEKCLEIEKDKGIKRKEELIKLHQAYFYGVIFNCVTFLEAYINEFFSDIYNGNFRDRDLDDNSLIQIRELWKHGIPRTSSYKIVEKYQIALILSNKIQFDKSKNPYQDIEILIKLRNSLIHYEPEYIPSNFKNPDVKIHKFENYLKGKIEINPFATSIDDFYPIKIISHSTCEWAINSVSKFIDDFNDKLYNKNSG